MTNLFCRKCAGFCKEGGRREQRGDFGGIRQRPYITANPAAPVPLFSDEKSQK